MKFTRRGFLRFGGAFIAGSAFAATLAGGATDVTAVLRTVNDRLAGEFISHDGLLLDYAGDIPTPEEIADLKPNAMGWWCPIENGSMFTGEWLPALMAEGVWRKELVERCVRGLIRMSEVSDVPGFIARGTGTDGKSHHPCGSNDQTDPWFLGLCEYCRWPHADAALKEKALERLVFVAKALEANAWGVPCDGPFKGQNRGNLNARKMPFWGKTRLMYSLKSLQTLTGDVHWGKVYDEIKAGALDEIEAGGEIDAKTFKACYGGGVWIYLSSAEALKRLIEMEENPSDRARMRKGFLRYAERVAPLMKDRAKYTNTTERPFKYANWRTGYCWRVQKTQKEAESVAYSGKPEILGTRKDYERVGMGNPLAAAAICALQGDAKFRDEIRMTLKHYDYSTPNVSEFFHAAIAAAALLAFGRVEPWKPSESGWPPRTYEPGPFRVFKDDADYLRRKFREDVTDPKTGLDNAALKKGVGELAQDLKTNGVPWRMVKARAVEYVLKNMAIDVSPRDWFPAIACWNRHARPVQGLIWQRSAEITQARRAKTAAAASAGNAEGKWTMWRDFDHSVPEWSAIIPLGYPGMKRRLLDNWKETPYYTANLVMIDACDLFLERLATQGELVARGVRGEGVERGIAVGRMERVRRQVEALRALRAGPPKTTYEALMFLWTYFFIGEHAECMQVRSLSALDITLTPFYRADLAAGRITEQEFREMLKHFWWQWGSVDNYWCQPVALGGTKPDGTSEFNEVTKIILDVHDELALPTPKVLVKTAPNTPDWAWDKMLDMHRRHRSLVYVGEEAIAKKGRALGWSEEEIRNAVLGGCYEVGRPRAAGCGAGHMNLLMPVQRILEDAVKGKVDLPAFEDFMAEYERRIRRETAACRDLVKSWELDLDEINPSLMFSLATDYSVRTGKDAFMHGTEFGRGSCMMQVGLGTTVDALLAVKELVYETKEFTPAGLGKVMAENWEGHETLRRRMLRSKRKWGNNSPEANALGKRVIQAFNAELKGQENLRGGKFSSSGHCARQFIVQGRKTGATPDGRLAGDEMSKNLSPTPGADTEGVTALINTITTLDYAEDVPGDMPVDVALHPSTVAGDAGLKLMRQIVETYHQKGGAQIHFNIFDPEELRDAQKHPEKYENLQVRVCGWNVRWNDLNRREQDEYIRRAESVAR